MVYAVWDNCLPQSWSIAKTLYELPDFKDRFRYIGGGKWEAKAADEWKIDKNQVKLKVFLQTTMVGQVMERSLYWQKLDHPDVHAKDAAVMRLLTIAGMLTKPTTVKDIIRDAKEFADC